MNPGFFEKSLFNEHCSFGLLLNARTKGSGGGLNIRGYYGIRIGSHHFF
jgi:hypothetical protein